MSTLTTSIQYLTVSSSQGNWAGKRNKMLQDWEKKRNCLYYTDDMVIFISETECSEINSSTYIN